MVDDLAHELEFHSKGSIFELDKYLGPNWVEVVKKWIDDLQDWNKFENLFVLAISRQAGNIDCPFDKIQDKRYTNKPSDWNLRSADTQPQGW